MTIDERLEFLLQSTESLHATAAEQTRQIQEHTRQVQEHTRQVQEHTQQLHIDADNIRRLANIAEAHEDRISDLENGNE